MCIFDWLFNLQVPKSTDRVVILGPASKTFVTGLARSYDEDYDYDRLKKHLNLNQFNQIIERINNNLNAAFPCNLCYIFGYICCPITFGLSLYCPALCINNAERYMRDQISRANRRDLQLKGIEMVFVKQCGTSWIEIRLPAEPPIAEDIEKAETLEDADVIDKEKVVTEL